MYPLHPENTATHLPHTRSDHPISWKRRCMFASKALARGHQPAKRTTGAQTVIGPTRSQPAKPLVMMETLVLPEMRVVNGGLYLHVPLSGQALRP